MAWPERDKHWFKRREFGIGWTPVTQAGWLCLLGFLFVLIIDIAYLVAGGPHPGFARDAAFGLILGLDIMALVWICIRTGDPLV